MSTPPVSHAVRDSLRMKVGKTKAGGYTSILSPQHSEQIQQANNGDFAGTKTSMQQYSRSKNSTEEMIKQLLGGPLQTVVSSSNLTTIDQTYAGIAPPAALIPPYQPPVSACISRIPAPEQNFLPPGHVVMSKTTVPNSDPNIVSHAVLRQPATSYGTPLTQVYHVAQPTLDTYNVEKEALSNRFKPTCGSAVNIVEPLVIRKAPSNTNSQETHKEDNHLFILGDNVQKTDSHVPSPKKQYNLPVKTFEYSINNNSPADLSNLYNSARQTTKQTHTHCTKDARVDQNKEPCDLKISQVFSLASGVHLEPISDVSQLDILEDVSDETDYESAVLDLSLPERARAKESPLNLSNKQKTNPIFCSNASVGSIENTMKAVFATNPDKEHSMLKDILEKSNKQNLSTSMTAKMNPSILPVSKEPKTKIADEKVEQAITDLITASVNDRDVRKSRKEELKPGDITASVNDRDIRNSRREELKAGDINWNSTLASSIFNVKGNAADKVASVGSMSNVTVEGRPDNMSNGMSQVRNTNIRQQVSSPTGAYQSLLHKSVVCSSGDLPEKSRTTINTRTCIQNKIPAKNEVHQKPDLLPKPKLQDHKKSEITTLTSLLKTDQSKKKDRSSEECFLAPNPGKSITKNVSLLPSKSEKPGSSSVTDNNDLSDCESLPDTIPYTDSDYQSGLLGKSYSSRARKSSFKLDGISEKHIATEPVQDSNSSMMSGLLMLSTVATDLMLKQDKNAVRESCSKTKNKIKAKQKKKGGKSTDGIVNDHKYASAKKNNSNSQQVEFVKPLGSPRKRKSTNTATKADRTSSSQTTTNKPPTKHDDKAGKLKISKKLFIPKRKLLRSTPKVDQTVNLTDISDNTVCNKISRNKNIITAPEAHINELDAGKETLTQVHNTDITDGLVLSHPELKPNETQPDMNKCVDNSSNIKKMDIESGQSDISRSVDNCESITTLSDQNPITTLSDQTPITTLSDPTPITTLSDQTPITTLSDPTPAFSDHTPVSAKLTTIEIDASNSGKSDYVLIDIDSSSYTGCVNDIKTGENVEMNLNSESSENVEERNHASVANNMKKPNSKISIEDTCNVPVSNVKEFKIKAKKKLYYKTHRPSIAPKESDRKLKIVLTKLSKEDIARLAVTKEAKDVDNICDMGKRNLFESFQQEECDQEAFSDTESTSNSRHSQNTKMNMFTPKKLGSMMQQFNISAVRKKYQYMFGGQTPHTKRQTSMYGSTPSEAAKLRRQNYGHQDKKLSKFINHPNESSGIQSKKPHKSREGKHVAAMMRTYHRKKSRKRRGTQISKKQRQTIKTSNRQKQTIKTSNRQQCNYKKSTPKQFRKSKVSFSSNWMKNIMKKYKHHYSYGSVGDRVKLRTRTPKTLYTLKRRYHRKTTIDICTGSTERTVASSKGTGSQIMLANNSNSMKRKTCDTSGLSTLGPPAKVKRSALNGNSNRCEINFRNVMNMPKLSITLKDEIGKLLPFNTSLNEECCEVRNEHNSSTAEENYTLETPTPVSSKMLHDFKMASLLDISSCDPTDPAIPQDDPKIVVDNTNIDIDNHDSQDLSCSSADEQTAIIETDTTDSEDPLPAIRSRSPGILESLEPVIHESLQKGSDASDIQDDSDDAKSEASLRFTRGMKRDALGPAKRTRSISQSFPSSLQVQKVSKFKTGKKGKNMYSENANTSQKKTLHTALRRKLKLSTVQKVLQFKQKHSPIKYAWEANSTNSADNERGSIRLPKNTKPKQNVSNFLKARREKRQRGKRSKVAMLIPNRIVSSESNDCDVESGLDERKIVRKILQNEQQLDQPVKIKKPNVSTNDKEGKSKKSFQKCPEPEKITSPLFSHENKKRCVAKKSAGNKSLTQRHYKPAKINRKQGRVVRKSIEQLIVRSFDKTEDEILPEDEGIKEKDVHKGIKAVRGIHVYNSLLQKLRNESPVKLKTFSISLQK